MCLLVTKCFCYCLSLRTRALILGYFAVLSRIIFTVVYTYKYLQSSEKKFFYSQPEADHILFATFFGTIYLFLLLSSLLKLYYIYWNNSMVYSDQSTDYTLFNCLDVWNLQGKRNYLPQKWAFINYWIAQYFAKWKDSWIHSEFCFMQNRTSRRGCGHLPFSVLWPWSLWFHFTWCFLEHLFSSSCNTFVESSWIQGSSLKHFFLQQVRFTCF